jgi:hypothetical protein
MNKKLIKVTIKDKGNKKEPTLEELVTHANNEMYFMAHNNLVRIAQGKKPMGTKPKTLTRKISRSLRVRVDVMLLIKNNFGSLQTYFDNVVARDFGENSE